MKKILLFLFVLITAHCVFGQRAQNHFTLEEYFNQGKEMFVESNYVGAQEMLSLFIAENRDRVLHEEAEYMIVVSDFKRGLENSGDKMKAYLNEYPETIHRNQLNMFIGTIHFDKKEWKLADFWFKQSNIDYLSSDEQDDFAFRSAYTDLQLGNKEDAARLFGLLSQNSKKYRDAGNFYYAYIDYTNGNINSALQRFEQLRNHPEYGEDVAFYTAQATFFDGKLQEAISLSNAFVNRYPQSEHLTEMYRILGNSYYRLGEINSSILHYEKYLDKTENPLRGDAYFMGLSYFEARKYSDAVKMFQQAVGDADTLTQNAQLQLGQTYLKLNQKQNAQMAFEAASRHKFDSKARETAMFNYALLVHETNFSVFSESITLFENFLREYPNSEYTEQVNDILAATFVNTKDYNAALNAINRISRPGKRILEAKQMVLLQLGVQDFINGNMNSAIQNFNSSVAMGNYDTKARNAAYYWRGEAYYRLNSFTNAANDFSQFVESATTSDENYSLGYYNLGYSRFKQEQYTQAVNAFQRYLQIESNKNRTEYADALNRVGDSYYFNRKFSEAERYYAQAADANSAVADYAMYQRAFVLGLQRNYQGKINALDGLMRQYPNSSYFDDALYEKSRALTMLGREDEAIALLKKLVSDYTRSSLASLGGVQLGQLYYNEGNYQQSIAAYKNVISNFPGTEDARNALLSLETVYRDINDIHSYVSYANSLPGGMRISPSRQDSLTFLAAEGAYMQNRKQEAQQSMMRYIQSYPNGVFYGDANYYLGVLSDEKGEKQQANKYFRHVVNTGSSRFSDNALLFVSQFEYEKGNYQQALADYSRLAASARSTTNQQAGQLGVVRTHSKLGNYFEATRAATSLLDNSNLSPEIITEARYLRGKAYKQTNEVEKAMSDFQFLANDTRDIYGAESQFILADTYYRWKSYDRAEQQVKTFMQKGTPHQYWMARALIVLSDTYKAKGDNFQAKQYIESLKANYKGNEPDIQQMINERLSN